MSYALGARSCVGWSKTTFAIACDFERLGEGLLELQQSGHAVITITYMCQGWRGRSVEEKTSLHVPKASLLAALKKCHYDLTFCQVVPRAQTLVSERLSEFHLPDHDLGILSKWALSGDPIEYALVPDGAPDRIAVRRNGQLDPSWTAAVGKPREVLERICIIQGEIARELSELRRGEIQP